MTSRAESQTGGLVGTVGFPPFVADTNRPTLDQFIDDIVYKVELTSIDHVGLGIDYFMLDIAGYPQRGAPPR